MRLATLLDPKALVARYPPGFGGNPDSWVAAGHRLLDLGYDEKTETRVFFVPGRIEVVGKHTDYAGGRSLVAATERGLYLAVAARRDRKLRLHDLRSGEQASVDLSGELIAEPGHWSAYPSAVARRLRRDFGLEPAGAEVVFSSDLPVAGGMSSSSALVVAAWWAMAVEPPADEGPHRLRLAEYLAAVEAGRATGATEGDRGVGTRGGSEDHTAILCSRAGRLGQYSYAPTRPERSVELADGLVFAIAASGVRAEKTRGARAAYNRLSDQAAELAARWRRETSGREAHLAAILARGPGAHEDLSRFAARSPSPGELTRRLEHFLAESEEIVPAATDALAAGELAAFGRVVDRSQTLAEELLDNQVPETVHLARSARGLGAPAASAFGAGFGGAVWALIERRHLASFLERWRNAYRDAHPERWDAASFFASRPGPGAFELGPRRAAPPRHG